MTTRREIARWGTDGLTDVWTPTTLDALGKDEAYFEQVLATSIPLLGIESRRTGIHGPFKEFRQLCLTAPAGRTIYPDVTILTASGHIIVVEVKRFVNSELRDRRVIAQIIDYASSLAVLSESELVSLFRGSSEAATWGHLISELFPDESDSDELAEVMLGRLSNGAVNLVIACDKIPPGLPEIVRGVAAQSTVGFDLDLVEVVPYVCEPQHSEILFIPSTRLTTEIVARTAITVTYREGDEQPSTRVETTSLEDVEDAIRTLKDTHTWTADEIEEAIREEGKSVVLDLMSFAKVNSHDGKFVSPAPKMAATFGFYIPITTENGSRSRRMVFSYTQGRDAIYVYIARFGQFLTSEVHSTYVERLGEIFGSAIDLSKSDAEVRLRELEGRLGQFKDLLLWLKEQVTDPE